MTTQATLNTSTEQLDAWIEASLSLDLRRVKFSGCPTIGSRIVLLIVKALRVKLPAQSDFPCVLTLGPFLVTREKMPARSIATIEPIAAQLSAIGFNEAAWHWVSNPLAVADSALLTMTRADGQAVARITCHHLRASKKPVIFVQFFSETNSDGMLMTWPRGFELAQPSDWHLQNLRGRTVTELWSNHRDKLHAIAQARGVRAIASTEHALEMLDRRQKQLAELQIQHRIFNPLTEKEREKLGRLFKQQDIAGQVSAEHADVLAEIDRLQNKTSNWGSTITILVLSLLAFVAAGMSREKWDVKFLAILVGVLFVHEFGHYFAMRLSGYRNLRMFFIPLLGAAVSGQSFNVPGWKKTLVSLMGPVPGILLAIPLGIVGVVMGWYTLTLIALMMLVINALNLLPVLPLDGGWVMHHVLFSRAVWLDVIFRVIAIGLLIAASAAVGDKFLMYIGIAMAVQTPLAFKLAKIVHGLRKEGFEPVSHDDQTIPPQAALPIVKRIKAAFPRGLSTRFAAMHTIAVFDNLNTRPPGVLASVGFLFAHGLSFVIALLFMVVFALGMAGGVEGIANIGKTIQSLRDIRQMTSFMDSKVSPQTIQTLSPMPDDAVPLLNLAVTCKSHEDAAAVGQRVLEMLPQNAGCLVFGQSVVVSLPAEDDTLRARIFDEFAKDDRQPMVHRPKQAWSLTMDCSLPESASNSLAQLEAWSKHPLPETVPAPWDATDTRTDEQKRQDADLAQVFGRITEAMAGDRDSTTKVSEKYAQAIRRGDRDAFDRMEKEMQQIRRGRLERVLDELDKQYPAYTGLYDACRKELADHEGKALWTDLKKWCKPYAREIPSDKVSIRRVKGAHVLIIKDRVNMTLSPACVEISGPAAVNYLVAHGASDIHYQLYSGPDYNEMPDFEE